MTSVVRMRELLSAEVEANLSSADEDEARKVALYKEGMRQFALSVAVVTAAENGTRFGFLSSGITSVSVEPPILLVSVNRDGSTRNPIARSGFFGVNVLRDGEESIARQFSTPDLRAKRFTAGEWITLATGAPILAGALVSFDCEVVEKTEIASHTIFYGRVLETKRSAENAAPLLYWRGKYESRVLSAEPFFCKYA